MTCKRRDDAPEPLDRLTMAFLGFKAGLTRLVRRIVDDPVDVEDIVHEAYLRSLEAGQSKLIESPKAYIARTARNLALNHIASARVRLSEPLWQSMRESGESSLEDRVEADRQFDVFCQAVETLPRQCRKVFTLRQVYGLSQKDIAARLGIAEKTVEYHVAKGLIHCRRHLRAAQSDGSVDRSAEQAQRMRSLRR